jgi:hypothetical protein
VTAEEYGVDVSKERAEVECRLRRNPVILAIGVGDVSIEARCHVIAD